MDCLTFIVRLLEATAWPVAAVIIAWMFRDHVKLLIPFIKKLKAGPLEAEFERGVQEAKREVEEISDEVPVEVRYYHEHLDPRQRTLAELAIIDPRAAILTAWLDVETILKRAAVQRALGSPVPDVSSPLRAMRVLTDLELVSSEDIALFHDLRGLRNQVAHASGFTPSEDAALEYIRLASLLASRLERLATPDVRKTE